MSRHPGPPLDPGMLFTIVFLVLAILVIVIPELVH